MTTESVPGNRRAGHLLRILPLVLVPIAFLASAPWLKATFGGPMVSLMAAPVAIFEMGYANYLSYRWQRRLDEVQRASAGFAAQWGPSIGQTIFVLLLMLPPVQHLATGVVARFAGDPGVAVDDDVVVFAITLGFMAVVLLQTIATAVVNGFWWKAKQ